MFRTEFRKITAVLCRSFGTEYLDIAEDLVSETFLSALESWPYHGIPESPVGWLYTVAKNKAVNWMKRNRTFREKIVPRLKDTAEKSEPVFIDLSAEYIKDSELRMLFTLCHPAIPEESQIGLALKILCGFGIEEIATAFLTTKEVISKRLYRARQRLKAEKLAMELPGENEIQDRLETVLSTLYLLFNEGYYSESHDEVLRKDLCLEAMRLIRLLIENERTNMPSVMALYSLMCFHASRFDARKSRDGCLILYQDQDRTLWDAGLISEGAGFLHQASVGDHVSRYHLEAAIAYWHTLKEDTPEKWEQILGLFNQLLRMEYSPVAALNRTYALYQVHGREAALKEAEKLNLTGNRYYYSLLGELYGETDPQNARLCFETAFSLARTGADQQLMLDKLKKFTP